MTPERWRQIKAVFTAALERAPNERAAFVAARCGGDAPLLDEVQSLLAASGEASLLDAPHPLAASLSGAPDLDAAGLLRRLAAALGDRYVLEREIGGGGMSRVFVAGEPALRRQVVVKVLRPDLAHGLSAERFGREVRFAARLQQANIVPVISAGEAEGLPYYTMPFVRGQSLRDRLASGAPVQPAEALGILKDVARALAYAHDLGVVHRDIKPENVLLSGGTAVVSDFGIAKAITAARADERDAPNVAITSEGFIIGTPAYMAPEQAAGEIDIDQRADVYAFGVVAYELLAGAHPFAGKRTRAEFLAAHIAELPRALGDRCPELPHALASLVMRCLAKECTARFRDGAALLAALEAVESNAVEALSLSRVAASGAPAAPHRRDAVNPEAFELYLRGRQLIEQRAEGMLEAMRCFERAIQLAPDFSAAYAGIAYAMMNFGIYHALSPREAFPRAREAADSALALDPADALALVMRAHTVLWHEWDAPAAETLARRALDLAPGLHLAHDCLAWTLAAQGHFDDAIAAMQGARALDPLSAYATYDLAWILILAGRWEEAVREMQPAIARLPLAGELHRAFGFCLLYANRAAEARAEFERVLELSAGDRWASANVVQALAVLGEADRARQVVRQLEERARDEPIPRLGIAISHHWLGNDEAAAEWLERSLAARDYWLVMLPFDPSMSRLRNEPRFQSVIERVRARPAL